MTIRTLELNDSRLIITRRVCWSVHYRTENRSALHQTLVSCSYTKKTHSTNECTYNYIDSIYYFYIVDPIAHWPLSEASQLNDMSSNSLHLQVVSGTASFGVDSTTAQSFLFLDDSFSARVPLSAQLRMSSDWSMFFAFNSPTNFVVFAFGDESSTSMSFQVSSHQLSLSTSVSLSIA